jgi:HD superfamily phosphodiesterase
MIFNHGEVCLIYCIGPFNFDLPIRHNFYCIVEADRGLDDTGWTLDHIKKKLLILNSMHTKTAKEIAKQRPDFIESFLNQLRSEILS